MAVTRAKDSEIKAAFQKFDKDNSGSLEIGELYDVFSEGDDSEGAEDDEEEGAWDSQDGYAVLLLLEHAQTQRTLASLLYRTRLRCRHSASLEAALLLSDTELVAVLVQ